MSSKITGKRENRENGSKELKVVRHFHLSLRVGPFLGLSFLKPVLSFFFTIEFRFSLFFALVYISIRDQHFYSFKNI